MKSHSKITLFLVMTAVVSIIFLPYSSAQDRNRENGDRSGMPGFRGPGGGPAGPVGRGGRGGGGGGRGGGRGDRFRGTQDLTDEQIDRIIESVKERDPQKAEELEKLRENEPTRFMNELRRQPEYFREMVRIVQENRNADFIKFLEKYIPEDAKELEELKKKDDLSDYTDKIFNLRMKYRPIYPPIITGSEELIKIRVSDFLLEEKQRALLLKIMPTKDEDTKKELIAQLRDVLSKRYDFKLRQMQIENEQLLKKLKEMQEDINKRIKEIDEWNKEEFKSDAIDTKVKELTGESMLRRSPLDY